MNDFSSVFFGTPEFAVDTLTALENANLLPDVIVTNPDKPAGRGLHVQPTPVKTWAQEREIPVLTPPSLKESSDELDIILNSEWDVFSVSAYGGLLPKEILELPKKGTLNVHPSLLPRYRGATPIESQILNDEKTVGVTIMLMDEELDHGPIVSQASITPEDWPLKSSMLRDLLGSVGGELLAETIPPWLKGEITAEDQDHTQATFTKKLKKEDGELKLSDDGYANYLKFCAYDQWPGTYFFIEKDGKKIRVKITDALYKDRSFVPLKVIPEGKKEIMYEQFISQNS